MKQQLLLLEDVDGLGRSGDIVTAKPGFIRNFLLPSKKAVVADKQTLKLQTRLKEERSKQALVDRKDAEAFSERIKELIMTIEMKVDPEGKMYGSVTTLDILRLLEDKGYRLDRKNVLLPQPLKNLGKHTINLKLKEGVLATFTLEIQPEGGLASKQAAASESGEGESEKKP